MTEQLSIFDAIESQRHRDDGMALAADNRAALLHEAREIAKDLAKYGREISADDVQAELVKRGYGVKALGNAAGSLFAGRDWQWTGRRVKSKRIHAHANELKTWRLVNIGI